MTLSFRRKPRQTRLSVFKLNLPMEVSQNKFPTPFFSCYFNPPLPPPRFFFFFFFFFFLLLFVIFLTYIYVFKSVQLSHSRLLPLLLHLFLFCQSQCSSLSLFFSLSLSLPLHIYIIYWTPENLCVNSKVGEEKHYKHCRIGLNFVLCTYIVKYNKKEETWRPLSAIRFSIHYPFLVCQRIQSMATHPNTILTMRTDTPRDTA